MANQVSVVVVRGPLAGFADRFGEALRALGYAPSSWRTSCG